MRTCAAGDCFRPATQGELCAGHAKRKYRHQPVAGPLAEVGRTPWQRLVDAALKYADADSDEAFARASAVLRKAAQAYVSSRARR